MRKRLLISLMAVLALFGQNLLHAQTAVTLTPTPTPTAGQPGVTSINVTGSGFPAGTILPASTSVSLQPAAGGSTVMTAATAVTTITGSTRRVTFTIPASIAVMSPTSYKVGVAGMTTTGVAFASTNTATLTVNPPARISSVIANKAEPGQSLTVTITGEFTNFLQGSTRASFGAGIKVGGAAENTMGPVTVTSPTTAKADLAINSLAAVGGRLVTVQTGIQQASLRAFSVIGVTVGANVNIVSSDPYSQKQLETDMSANPLNPNHISNGYIDYQTIIIEPTVTDPEEHVVSKGICGKSFSTNGGKTWKSGLVDFVGELSLATVAKCGDPATAWDTSGHVYMLGLVQLQDAAQSRRMYIWRYLDPDDGSGQLIFEAQILVDSYADPKLVLDKGALMFQPDATSTNPNAPGTLYACYALFNENLPGNPSDIRCAISRDGGLNFSVGRYNGNLALNNGSSLAPAPNGAAYLFWRSFEGNDNGHYFVLIQPDGSATAPVAIVGGNSLYQHFYPYDTGSMSDPNPPTTGFPAASKDLARSEGFPSGTSDGGQTMLLTFQAYSAPNGKMAASTSPTSSSPHIFGMVSTDGGAHWSEPTAIDYGPHSNVVQFMPRATFAGGVFSVIYYDGRNDGCYDQEPSLITCKNFGVRALSGPFKDDDGNDVYLPTGRDRRFDVRVIQAHFVNGALVFGNYSTQVTRYQTRASDHKIVNRNGDPINCNTPECAAVGLTNLLVGAGGTQAWMGDYIAHTPKVQFVRNTNPALPAWRFANQLTDPHTFLASWADFSGVAFPLDLTTGKFSINGPWNNFIPACIPGDLQHPCPANSNNFCVNPKSRDVNVLFSEITDKGLSASIRTTAQKTAVSPPEFTVNVNNMTGGTLFLRVQIADTAPSEDWSTVQTLPDPAAVPTDDNFVDVKVLSNSSITQTIYYRWRTSSNPMPGNPVTINVFEIDKPGGSPLQNGGLSTSATYNISYTTGSGPAHKITLSPPVESTFKLKPGSFTRRGQPSNNLLDNNLLDNNLLDNNLLDNNLLDNNLLDNNLLDNNLLDNNLLDNSLVEDKQIVWTTTGGGAITTATRAITNLANGQELLKAGWKFQLLFYQSQKNPKVFQCKQLTVPTDNLLSIVSINTPNTNLLDNFQVSNNLLDNNLLDNNLLDNSAISDQVSNATLPVDSNEELQVALRAYKPPNSPLSMAFTSDAPKVFAVTSSISAGDTGEANFAAARDPNTGATVFDIVDETPPLVTPIITGSLGTCLVLGAFPDVHGNSVSICTDGWYHSDVNVSWLVRDPTSGIMSAVGCDPTALTTETSGTSLTCTATNNDTHAFPHATTVTITIRIDKTKPTITAAATKADNTPYTSGSWTNQTVTVKFTCTDPPGVPSGVSSGVTGHCPADLVFSSDGSFATATTVTDLAGNVSDPSNSILVRIDKTSPVVTLTTNPAAPNGLNGYFVTTPVGVTVFIDGNISGAQTLVCTDTFNGSPIQVLNATGIETQTFSQNVNLSGDGVHNLSCTGTDRANNNGANAIAVKIDSVKPDTTITAGPADGSTITTNSTSFSFNGTDPAPSSGGPTFECKLDNGAFAACTSPRALTNLADGSHTFSVRAVDTAGNTDATPASSTFTVNTAQFFGSTTDPVGDATAGEPDLVSATIKVLGPNATFHIDFAPGTFNSATTQGQFLLDTDQNPATGHPGSNAGGVDDAGIIGSEYLLNMGSTCQQSGKTYIYKYAGTVNNFDFVGSLDTTFSANGMEVTVPLSMLGNDDGKMNFKVTAARELLPDNPCGYTGVTDYMPNLGLAAASTTTVVYSNNFEDPATAFNGLAIPANTSTLASLTRASLPTDSGGISSPNQSMWLGKMGLDVTKSSTVSEIVTLSLTGLTPGTAYRVSLDLLIGGSWDGSAGTFGPDQFKLTATSGANSATLINATFSNCGVNNELCGATSPQSYSDATPTAGPGPSGVGNPPETGADFYNDTGGPSFYYLDYGIYYFSHGAGNPVLTFTAGASTATLTFERLPIASGDSSDEYWAVDNIIVFQAP